MKVSIFLVALFAFAKCISAGDPPISTAELQSDPKRANFILPRVKRQIVYQLDNQQPSQGLQPREQTVIIVPENGGNGYRGGSNSQYGSNTNVPNRGTKVVVSQVPEYGYNGGSKNNG